MAKNIMLWFNILAPAVIGVALLVALLLFTGCTLFNANDYTKSFDKNKPDVVIEHEVSVWGGSVLTKKGIDGLKVDYGEVKISVDKYSQAGDTEMMNAIGNAIVNGIIAYGSYGTVPAVKGAVMLALQPNATNANLKASEATVK